METFTLGDIPFVRIGNLDVPAESILYIERTVTDGTFQGFVVVLKPTEYGEAQTVLQGRASIDAFALEDAS